MKCTIFLCNSDIDNEDEIVQLKSKINRISYIEQYYNEYFKDELDGVFKYVREDGRIFYECEINTIIRENDVITCKFGYMSVQWSCYNIDKDEIQIIVKEI